MQEHAWKPWTKEFDDFVARCTACGLAVWVVPIDELPADTPGMSVWGKNPPSTDMARKTALRLVGKTCPGLQDDTQRKQAHSLSLILPPLANTELLECGCNLRVTADQPLRRHRCQAMWVSARSRARRAALEREWAVRRSGQD